MVEFESEFVSFIIDLEKGHNKKMKHESVILGGFSLRGL